MDFRKAKSRDKVRTCSIPKKKNERSIHVHISGRQGNMKVSKSNKNIYTRHKNVEVKVSKKCANAL